MHRLLLTAMLVAFGLTESGAQSTPVQLSQPVFVPSEPSTPAKQKKKKSKNGLLRAVANSALNLAVNVAESKLSNTPISNSGTSNNISPTTGNYGVPAANNINPTSGYYGTSATNASTPINQLSTPVTNGFKPVQQLSTPVTNGFTPVELSTPVKNAFEPLKQLSTPVTDGFKPVQQLSNPVTDGFKPVQQLSTPVTNGFTPVELSTPVKNAFEPLKLLSTPVTDGFKPVQQLSTPVANGFTSSQQMSKPVELGSSVQLSKPVEINSTVNELTTPAWNARNTSPLVQRPNNFGNALRLTSQQFFEPNGPVSITKNALQGIGNGSVELAKYTYSTATNPKTYYDLLYTYDPLVNPNAYGNIGIATINAGKSIYTDLPKAYSNFKNADEDKKANILGQAAAPWLLGKGAGEVSKSTSFLKTASTEYFDISKNGRKIALGVSEHLDDFAKSTGGETWKIWGANDFQSNFLQTIKNPSSQIHFNLDGINNPWSAVAEGAKGFNTSRATSWELYQLYSNQNALQRTVFYRSGKVVSNPFR